MNVQRLIDNLLNQPFAHIGKQIRHGQLKCFHFKAARDTLKGRIVKGQNVVFQPAPRLRLVRIVNGIDFLKLLQPSRVFDRHRFIAGETLSVQPMAMKNLVIRSAHFCANTSLELDKCKFLAELTARVPHVDISAVPVWVNGVKKERQEGAVIILHEVGQRRTCVPTNGKLDWDRVLLPFAAARSRSAFSTAVRAALNSSTSPPRCFGARAAIAFD